MQGSDGHVDLEAVLVDPREVVALHFYVIELVKAEEVVKVENLIIFREDAVGRPDMADVEVFLLLAHHEDTNLYPLFFELILQNTS